MRLVNKKEVYQRVQEMIEFYSKGQELSLDEMENWAQENAYSSNFFKQVLEIIKPSGLNEVQNTVELLTDFWNVTPRKELNSASPQEMFSMETAGMIPYSDKDIESNFLLLDIEAFLGYMLRNNPVRLTEKGNLNVKSLLEIADFLKDPDFRESHQRFMEISKTATEENIPYIQRLHYISEFLRIIYKRKGKVFTNKLNYQRFQLASKNLKFDQILQSYLGPINWAYFHPYGEPNFAELIQSDKPKLWNFLNSYIQNYKDKWIQFEPFAKEILKEFGIKFDSQNEFSRKLDVEYVLLKGILKLFSLVELQEEKRDKFSKILVSFRFTPLAEKVIPRQIKLEEVFDKVYKSH